MHVYASENGEGFITCLPFFLQITQNIKSVIVPSKNSYYLGDWQPDSISRVEYDERLIRTAILFPDGTDVIIVHDDQRMDI